MDIRQVIKLLETRRFKPETFCQSLRTACVDVQRSADRKDVVRQLASLAEVARVRARFLPPGEQQQFLTEVNAILGVTGG